MERVCLPGCLITPDSSSGTRVAFRLSLTPVALHRQACCMGGGHQDGAGRKTERGRKDKRRKKGSGRGLW